MTPNQLVQNVLFGAEGLIRISKRTLIAALCAVVLSNDTLAQILKALEPLSAAEFAGAMKGALQDASSFEVLSLDWKDWAADGDAERVHGWRVLGKAEANAEERERLVDALIRAVALAPEESADCFVPRHGIRITSPRGLFVFLICFTCSRGEAYSGAGMRPVFLNSDWSLQPSTEKAPVRTSSFYAATPCDPVFPVRHGSIRGKSAARV